LNIERNLLCQRRNNIVEKFVNMEGLGEMIIKKRDHPFYLMQLQSLERRLSINHPKIEEVRNNRINEMTGLKGEKQIDFPLSFLCPKEYQVLHQVRLRDAQGFFQLDCLILHKNFVLILEVKNWFGTLMFGPKGQVIRMTQEEVEDGFPNPIQQVKLQKFRLKNWLQEHGFPEIPLHCYIVIADNRTIIKEMTPQIKIPNNIIYSNQLFFEIDHIKSKFSSEHYSQNQLNKLAIILKNSHKPNRIDISKKYEVSRADIIPGVACPSCNKYSMIKTI